MGPHKMQPSLCLWPQPAPALVYRYQFLTHSLQMRQDSVFLFLYFLFFFFLAYCLFYYCPFHSTPYLFISMYQSSLGFHSFLSDHLCVSICVSLFCHVCALCVCLYKYVIGFLPFSLCLFQFGSFIFIWLFIFLPFAGVTSSFQFLPFIS